MTQQRDPKILPPTLAHLPKHVHKLMTMLQFKRPANSKTEAIFCKRYLRPVGARADAAGNYWLTIPGNDHILFSSHTDTVHKTPGMQSLLYDAGSLSAKDSNCLGADCGVGVWLMLEMIKARVPGTYVFHAEEEIGGIGSKYVASKTPERIKDIKFAIAFDRAGTDEIITHQWCGRTASDAFAGELAQLLHPLKYAKSEHGSFTDTASYAHLIPECTNIGVGYFKQHQAHEHLDIPHAMALREALCAAHWSTLAAYRDPTVREPRAVYGGRYGGTTFTDNWHHDPKTGKWTYQDEKAAAAPKDNYRSWWEKRLEELEGEALADYVKREHRDVAEFLEHHGFGKSDVEHYIWTQSGVA